MQNHKLITHEMFLQQDNVKALCTISAYIVRCLCIHVVSFNRLQSMLNTQILRTKFGFSI